MTQTVYPEVILVDNNEENIELLYDAYQEVTRLREQEDISDFTNLEQRFVRGRGLFEQRLAPSSSSDVLATDELGDIVNDNTYEYKLLNISGVGLRWDRRLLSVSW